jgi:hypothetical protein
MREHSTHSDTTLVLTDTTTAAPRPITSKASAQEESGSVPSLCWECGKWKRCEVFVRQLNSQLECGSFMPAPFRLAEIAANHLSACAPYSCSVSPFGETLSRRSVPPIHRSINC